MKKIKVKVSNVIRYSVFAFVNPIIAIWFLSFLFLNKLGLIEIIEG